MSILIITDPYDAPTRLVTQALIQKKSPPLRWFPLNRISHQMGTFSLQDDFHPTLHRVGLEDLNLSDIDVVWDRTPALYRQHAEFPNSDNAFISSEQKKFLHALNQLLETKATWINPVLSQYALHNKAIPLIEAQKLGLKTPDTIFSNNRDCILDFMKSHAESNVLYKSYSTPCWVKNDIIYKIKPISISEKMFSKRSILQLSPGIYQKKIQSNQHVVVVMLGNDTHSFAISNIHHISWEDLRRYPSINVKLVKPPENLITQCHQLREKLGLIVASCHFMIDASGEPLFISMQDNPAFLWFEKHLPEYPLLDLFCEFLLSRVNKKTDNLKVVQQPPIRFTETIGSAAYQTLLLRDQYLSCRLERT